MKVALWIYDCEEHGEFRAASRVVDDGLLLVRSTGSGTPRVLEVTGDAFRQVRDAVNSALGPAASQFREGERAWRYMSAVSDHDRDGSPFTVDAVPPCPRCHRTRVLFVQATDPPEFAEEDIAPLTFDRWLSLGPDEQEALIRSVG